MEELHAYIPEDMMVQIFLRLSVKSLIRLRCVCKSWYRIIGSSSFIKASVSNITNRQFLLCTHYNFYSLISGEESATCKITYYMPELFAPNARFYNIKFNYITMIYGSCNGLLCVSDIELKHDSSIYLVNPFIRKAKELPTIPDDHVDEMCNSSFLCFGYFDDDYKVIKISVTAGVYRVRVYSLRTNCWKITNWDSEDGTFVRHRHPWAKIFGGVAYFWKYQRRIVCFDLHDEKIREVKFPEKFNPVTWMVHRSSSLEFCRESESLVLIEIGHGELIKWVLRNRAATKTSTWEKEASVKLPATANIYPIGFTNNGTYMLGDSAHAGDFYLCDFGTSELKDLVWDEEEVHDLYKIDNLTESLDLLNEESVNPVVKMDPCSSRVMFVLHKGPGPVEKGKRRVYRSKRPTPLQGGRRRRRKVD